MRRLCSILLLSVAGCTLWEVSTPCDSAPEVSVEQDPLWTSSRTTWQKPAVGDGFVCGFRREEGEITLPAPLDSLACAGPDASALLPGADDGILSEASVLVGGGSMLCAAEEFVDPDATAPAAPTLAAFDCWGPGAEAALKGDPADDADLGLRGVLEASDHQPAVLHSLSPAADFLCAIVTIRDGLTRDDGSPLSRKEVRCHGSGSVVEGVGGVQDYAFDEVQVSASMACGRADEVYVVVDADGDEQAQPLADPKFVCWGDAAETVRLEDPDQSACWSTFDVTDGVLCATGSPPPLDADAPDPCPDTPPVQCWGPDDHPIVAGLQEADAVLEAAAPPFRLSLGPDFACAHYDPAMQDADDAVVCWGAEDSLAGLTPSGGAWQELAVAPEAYHACALDQSEQDLDPDETEPPPPTGRLSCWAGDQAGALALEDLEDLDSED